MINLVWHNEKRKVRDLTPYAKNRRILTEFKAKKLEEGLKKFNLVEIPAIDVDNTIIAGHQRLKILILLGRGDEEIDVRVPNRKLTDEELQEYNLRSNVPIGEWDFELLKDIDIDLLLDVGFEETDLSQIWDNQLAIDGDEFDEQIELKKIKEPITKPGDIYLLGSHKLLCFDSNDPDSVKKLTNERNVSLMINDPIYNISLNYDKGFGKRSKYGGTVNDTKTDAKYKEFLKKAMVNGLSICKSDAHIFYFCDESYIWLIQTLYQELGITNRRVCLWIKNNQNPTPGVAFSKAYEPCVYGSIGKPYLSPLVKNLNEIMDKEVSTGNGTLDDIIDLFNIWLVKRLPTSEYEHATSKPPTLYEKALRRCTIPGDIVLDLYAGGGPLIVAAEQLKRKALLVEIEPIFCDLIIRRYEHLTGIKTIKVT